MTPLKWLIATTVVTCSVFGVGLARLSSQSPPAPAPTGIVDSFQRSYEVYRYNEVAASGVARGETLYFYKCWMCHNALAQNDTSGLAGPVLKDLFKRPMTDAGVAAKIKAGGPFMPAYRHTLTDADIADLIAYLRSPTCCYEMDEPPKNPNYRAETQKWSAPNALKGGPRGLVKTLGGQPLEGIKVQLIAPNAVRTTVFSNAEGRYKFPSLQGGTYTLRIATPAPFQPFVREAVQISGPTTLDDIALGLVPSASRPGELQGALPPTPEVLAQMSGAEMLWNLSGTLEEKTAFAKTCGIGCHSYELILRNRYDERGWSLIADRMTKYTAASILPPRTTGAVQGAPADSEQDSMYASTAELDRLVKWLAKVRGPDSKDAPVRMFPRPSGAATRVVITEFEAPRRLLNIHDVCLDARGNVWYTSHHTPYAGMLDPRTGIVKEYKIPVQPGRLTGTHGCLVDDKRGVVWMSPPPWPGTKQLTRITMATGEMKQFAPSPVPGNFGLAPDGSLWGGDVTGTVSRVVRFDPDTGKVTNTYQRPNTPGSYQHAVSVDGRFVAGASPPGFGYNTGWMLDLKTGRLYESITGDRIHSGARGGFDRFGNAWFGGRDGAFVQLLNEIDKGKGIQTRLFWPPTPLFPYTVFYTATPDKNGEVWGGVLHGRGFVRFNPRTERWVVYENPEPSALNRYQMIDDSTTPPTIWYPDFHTGQFVRIQPLE